VVVAVMVDSFGRWLFEKAYVSYGNDSNWGVFLDDVGDSGQLFQLLPPPRPVHRASRIG
jgi:hypothetical protein